MNPWRECWTWCSAFLTGLIYHACFRVIHIEGGLWQSSECIETKLWPLQERSSRLVKTWVWALFLFSLSKNIHFLSPNVVCSHTLSSICILSKVFAWYVHLFSRAAGSTCLPESQTIPCNVDGLIFPFFCPVWFPFRWGCWIRSNRDSESRQTMKKVIVYRHSGGTRAESMFCSTSHWLVHGAVLCKVIYPQIILIRKQRFTYKQWV